MTYGQPQYADIHAALNQKFAEKGTLIAVHRGSWSGNITQNTVRAYSAALQMGADMVEADVNASTDGVLYSFHDGYEPRVFGVKKSIKAMSSEEIESYHPINHYDHRTTRRISRLEEILAFLSHGELLNIDRAWDIFPQLVAFLDRFPAALRQVLIKAPVRRAKEAVACLAAHPVKYMFMPICYTMDDVRLAREWPGLNTVGAELIAFTQDDELFGADAVRAVHDMGLFTWANVITLGDWDAKPLYGGLDDDLSVIESPDLGWGRVMDMGFDVLQTDWPALLWQYRRNRSGVE